MDIWQPRFVATIAPMKRGLKAYIKNHNHTSIEVATIAPMKRGLKANKTKRPLVCHSRSNHCPDEKGTERVGWSFEPVPLRIGSNHCPDEKGTESRILNPQSSFPIVVATIAPMKRGLKDFIGNRLNRQNSRSNHCPDEKGTERNDNGYYRYPISE